MFYQFSNQTEFESLLPEGLVIEGTDGGNAELSISVIGEIAGAPGWHVNAIGNIPESWQEFEVFPSAPMRVFA